MNSGESVMVATHCQLVRIYNYLGDGLLLTEDCLPCINLYWLTTSLLAGTQDCVSRVAEQRDQLFQAPAALTDSNCLNELFSFLSHFYWNSLSKQQKKTVGQNPWDHIPNSVTNYIHTT